jgi:hypothetical protein
VTDGNDYLRLRETFNEDAERYDRARPHYPEQMFDDLAAAGAAPGARVLETGCGTGRPPWLWPSGVITYGGGVCLSRRSAVSPTAVSARLTLEVRWIADCPG